MQLADGLTFLPPETARKPVNKRAQTRMNIDEKR